MELFFPYIGKSLPPQTLLLSFDSPSKLTWNVLHLFGKAFSFPLFSFSLTPGYPQMLLMIASLVFFRGGSLYLRLFCSSLKTLLITVSRLGRLNRWSPDWNQQNNFWNRTGSITAALTDNSVSGGSEPSSVPGAGHSGFWLHVTLVVENKSSCLICSKLFLLTCFSRPHIEWGRLFTSLVWFMTWSVWKRHIPLQGCHQEAQRRKERKKRKDFQ